MAAPKVRSMLPRVPEGAILRGSAVVALPTEPRYLFTLDAHQEWVTREYSGGGGYDRPRSELIMVGITIVADTLEDAKAEAIRVLGDPPRRGATWNLLATGMQFYRDPCYTDGAT